VEPIRVVRLFTARRYARAAYAVIVCLSVRPSVRPSVTRRYFTTTTKQHHANNAHDSPGTLVFWCQKLSYRNFSLCCCRWARSVCAS